MKNLFVFIFCLIAAIGYSQDRSENKIEQIDKHCSITHTLAQQSPTTSIVYYKITMTVQEDTLHRSYGFIVAKLEEQFFGVWLSALDKTKVMFFSCNVSGSASNGTIYFDKDEYTAKSNSGRTMHFYQKADSVFIPLRMHKQTRDKDVVENYIFK